MFFTCDNENFRYTGRFGECSAWAAKPNMTTVTPGAYFEFLFVGEYAEMMFDVDLSYEPRGHLYIEVDGGARIESTIEKFVRISAKGEGPHYVKVIYKSTVEQLNRWYLPLNNKLAFLGADAQGLTSLPADNRKTVEYIGDSITEGVLVATNKVYSVDAKNRPWQDDATSTWGWLFCEAMNFRPYSMGYGATGLTRSGCGCVPKAADAYPFNFEKCPINFPSCDYIIINHGANDRASGNVPNERYYVEYEAFLKLLRERNPESKIVILTPFTGPTV